MTSDRCIEGKFWNRARYKCEPCETKYLIIKGYEFIENCGWSDEQQQIESPYKPCRDGTFNNGSQVKCQNCRSCPTPQLTASECSTSSDAICCRQGEQAFNGKCIPQPWLTTRITTASTTVFISSSVASSSPSPSTQNVFPEPSTSTQSFMPITTPSSTEISSIDQFIELKKCCNGASHESLSKKGIGRYEQAISYNIIKESSNNDHVTGSSHLLAPEVQDAPLKTVLNNLDVLEELVLVLDPDISGAKNTRHLAAQCSFSFAWINYAYSMKDHKSPLVAVLEGVVTKNPDWTVSHLAELLTAISRNDAVEILAKLPAGV
uniref:IGF-like family receptor 1 n=1 Tax=Sinocyclocheilus rhinocerous TaxID=307959 RepID=A0A673G8U5_9TELE